MTCCLEGQLKAIVQSCCPLQLKLDLYEVTLRKLFYEYYEEKRTICSLKQTLVLERSLSVR